MNTNFEYNQAINENSSCPVSPLDYGSEELWVPACEEILSNLSNETDIVKVEEEVEEIKDKNETNFELKMAAGGGMSQGLTIVVDSLSCGWLPSSIYDGIKVFFLQ